LTTKESARWKPKTPIEGIGNRRPLYISGVATAL
jgi:hypothetical protein